MGINTSLDVSVNVSSFINKEEPRKPCSEENVFLLILHIIYSYKSASHAKELGGEFALAEIKRTFRPLELSSIHETANNIQMLWKMKRKTLFFFFVLFFRNVKACFKENLGRKP